MCVLAYFCGAQLCGKHLSTCITELQRLVLICVGNLFAILIQMEIYYYLLLLLLFYDYNHKVKQVKNSHSMPPYHLLGMVPSSCPLAIGLTQRCIALIIPLCSRSLAAWSSVYTGDGVCSAGFHSRSSLGIS